MLILNYKGRLRTRRLLSTWIAARSSSKMFLLAKTGLAMRRLSVSSSCERTNLTSTRFRKFSIYIWRGAGMGRSRCWPWGVLAARAAGGGGGSGWAVFLNRMHWWCRLTGRRERGAAGLVLAACAADGGPGLAARGGRSGLPIGQVESARTPRKGLWRDDPLLKKVY